MGFFLSRECGKAWWGTQSPATLRRLPPVTCRPKGVIRIWEEEAVEKVCPQGCALGRRLQPQTTHGPGGREGDKGPSPLPSSLPGSCGAPLADPARGQGTKGSADENLQLPGVQTLVQKKENPPEEQVGNVWGISP